MATDLGHSTRRTLCADSMGITGDRHPGADSPWPSAIICQ